MGNLGRIIDPYNDESRGITLIPIDRISVSDFNEKTLQGVLAEKTQHRVQWLNKHSEKILTENDSNTALIGTNLPWSKTHGKVCLQEGAVSTWIGIDGHKKSSVLNQVAVFAARDQVVGIASFEMDVRSLGQLMIQQAYAAQSPSRELAQRFLDWSSHRVLCYDHVGTVKAIEVYALVVKMARDYGAKFVVIDCLQMISGVCGDNEQERSLMSMLVQLAKGFNIHIALVHHARKPDKGGDEYMPTRFDALGSTSISQLSSILAIVWSDKKKQRLLDQQELGVELSAEDEEYLDRPDTRIVVAKNRHIPFEGTIALWQHKSRQFTATADKKTMSI